MSVEDNSVEDKCVKSVNTSGHQNHSHSTPVQPTEETSNTARKQNTTAVM